MTAVLDVETEDFVGASVALTTRLGEPVADAVSSLAMALEGSTAMAGSDDGGLAWAAQYDRAVQAALPAGVDVANGVFRLAQIFAQSARNYEAADVASTPGARSAAEASIAGLPSVRHAYLPVCVGSAAGGRVDEPPLWGLLLHVAHLVWPNGDIGRLRSAGDAWLRAGESLGECAYQGELAALPFEVAGLPEWQDMQTVCQGASQHVTDLADAYRGIGASCHEYADHLHHVQGEIKSELLGLGWQTGVIEGISLLAGLVSAGTAEAPGQAVEAGRLARAAYRVAELIRTFTAAARAAAATLSAKVDDLVTLAAKIRKTYALKLDIATLHYGMGLPKVVELRESFAMSRLALTVRNLPDLIPTFEQLRDKFKHAEVFGILTTKKNTATINEFGRAVQEFMDSPETIRVPGKFYGDPAILNYNPRTGIAVIQRPNGSFWSAWELSPKQLRNVRMQRSLGGK